MLMILISDKRQVKLNIEQIGFQIVLESVKSAETLASFKRRLFHTVGRATEKARSPNLVLVRRTMKSRLLAE